jgi:hypothetical protein
MKQPRPVPVLPDVVGQRSHHPKDSSSRVEPGVDVLARTRVLTRASPGRFWRRTARMLSH